MGTERTYILYDEFDWNYVGSNKDDVLSLLKGKPGVTVLAHWRCYIVVDVSKTAWYRHKDGVPTDGVLVIENDSFPRVPDDWQINGPA